MRVRASGANRTARDLLEMRRQKEPPLSRELESIAAIHAGPAGELGDGEEGREAQRAHRGVRQELPNVRDRPDAEAEQMQETVDPESALTQIEQIASPTRRPPVVA